MNGDYLQLDEDVIDSFVNRYSKSKMTLEEGGANGKKQFSSLIDTGLGGTAEVITDDMNEISNLMNDFSMMFKKGTNQIFESDKIAAAEFQKIDVPTQFVANSANETTKHVSIFMDKTDGQSVNNGAASTAFNEIADNTIEKEALSDIRGADSTVEVYDSQSSINGKSILGDIRKENTVGQNYTDAYTEQEKTLKDINNNQTQQQEMKDTYTEQEKALKDINNNQTQQQEMKDTYTEQEKALKDINNNQTQQQEFDSSLSIASQSALGNITSKDTKQQFYTDTTEVIKDQAMMNNNENKENGSEAKKNLDEQFTKFATNSTVNSQVNQNKTTQTEDKNEEEVVEVDYSKYY